MHDLYGNMGLGVISDYEDQSLFIHSRLGTYATATVGRLHNLDNLVTEIVSTERVHLLEMRGNETNQTELAGLLINREESFAAGTQHVWGKTARACSILLLTADAIYAAQDKYGRTPVLLAEKKNDGTIVVPLESCTLSNPDLPRGASTTPAGDVAMRAAPWRRAEQHSRTV